MRSCVISASAGEKLIKQSRQLGGVRSGLRRDSYARRQYEYCRDQDPFHITLFAGIKIELHRLSDANKKPEDRTE